MTEKKTKDMEIQEGCGWKKTSIDERPRRRM